MRAPGIGLPVVAACSIADEKKRKFLPGDAETHGLPV